MVEEIYLPPFFEHYPLSSGLYLAKLSFSTRNLNPDG